MGLWRQGRGILEEGHMNKGMVKGVDPTGVGSHKVRNKTGQILKSLHDWAKVFGFIL